MAAPMIFVGMIAVAFGILVLMVRMGGEADGAKVHATLRTSCAQESTEVLKVRMDAMGLGTHAVTPTSDGLQIEMTLPGTEAEISRIPNALARRGEISFLSAAGEVLTQTAHITGAGVEIDNAGMPTTLVQFDDVAKRALRLGLEAGAITVQIDAEPVGEFTRLPDLEEGYLELLSGEGATAQRMRVAADRSIILSSGPLPCPAKVQQVVKVP